MPIFFSEYRNESPRIAAWTAHYIAKGCHPVKAEHVANKKVERSRTWPPKTYVPASARS